MAGPINTLGLSHGGIIARYIAESCEGVTVNKWVSIGGPNQGVATFPNCHTGWFCDLVTDAIQLGVYTKYVQDHIGPAGYFKDQYRLTEYANDNTFLPPLNNHPGKAVASRKSKLAALDHAILVRFTEDTVVDPRFSEWFGEYAANSRDLVYMNETELYKEDWIGIKDLQEADKITYIAWVGNHLQFNTTQVDEFIIPLLIN